MDLNCAIAFFMWSIQLKILYKFNSLFYLDKFKLQKKKKIIKTTPTIAAGFLLLCTRHIYLLHAFLC